ncbi:MAG: bifunctional 2-polyprenyl-6-hydroxyphenol methylase/3-demethylubiquinol 3-O-methyltransferase UbiG [Alphaproteobacteria bacterium]|nr:bifunctional 2-polyprenyl-6-hydroxyphenol methylase/3-demethylubiquinol 3-O-methyltransferase UbiG [Alphaproteobacteria bacterium]
MEANVTGTASADEVARFTAMAEEWWDPSGKFRPLHRFNPVRLDFIREQTAARLGRDPAAERPFEGLSLLDIGCGGGLLAEPLAQLGFAVTGIDAGDRNVAVARIHAESQGLGIDYQVAMPEDLDRQWDVVLAMEVIEHVPDVDAFLSAASARVRPGGLLFAATLNRGVKSFALAIVGAEYVLRWLPRGTHDWRKFVKPSEFAAGLRRHGVETKALKGMGYDIAHDTWSATDDLSVNYMLCGVKG